MKSGALTYFLVGVVFLGAILVTLFLPLGKDAVKGSIWVVAAGVVMIAFPFVMLLQSIGEELENITELLRGQKKEEETKKTP